MKKVLLTLLVLFISSISAFSFEDVNIPYDNSKNRVLTPADEKDPQVITGTVSLIENVPDGFYGTWKVVSVQTYSNNPFMFNSTSVDVWKLEKRNNNLILTNPESGATATVTLEDVQNNTIKFVRKSDTPYEKVVETPEITLSGENFFGTDTIVINKYKNNTYIGKEVVQFKVKGIKQSGASVNDLIYK
ncbi:hypothetical protein IJS77_04780 [bacterium]|nr:hypothetical protein [bacterium]